MLSGLLLTALLMGLGGIPHCALMCGAPCAAAFPRGVPRLALVGRAMGYAILGAVAAASAGLVAAWGRDFTALRPFWFMAQFGAVLFGIWLAWRGRVPAWLDHAGVALYHRVKARFGVVRAEGRTEVGLRHVATLVAGMGWALLPCGLLYGALMVAVLAPHPAGGALVMLTFAVGSTAGVWFAPAVLAWLTRRVGALRPDGESSVGVAPVLWLRRDPAPVAAPALQAVHAAVPSRTATAVDPRWALRISGALLALMSGWGLSHHLLDQWRAWCA